MNNNKTIPLLEQDLSTISKLCLNVEELEKRAAKCESLVDMFAEALESMCEKGSRPVNGATYVNVAEVIRQYSLAVKNGTVDIHNKLSALSNSLKGGVLYE